MYQLSYKYNIHKWKEVIKLSGGIRIQGTGKRVTYRKISLKSRYNFWGLTTRVVQRNSTRQLGTRQFVRSCAVGSVKEATNRTMYAVTNRFAFPIFYPTQSGLRPILLDIVTKCTKWIRCLDYIHHKSQQEILEADGSNIKKSHLSLRLKIQKRRCWCNQNVRTCGLGPVKLQCICLTVYTFASRTYNRYLHGLERVGVGKWWTF